MGEVGGQRGGPVIYSNFQPAKSRGAVEISAPEKLGAQPDFQPGEKLGTVPIFQTGEKQGRGSKGAAMGIQFRELVTWVRHRKVFAGVLAALTLGIGILIGTVIPGKVVAIRPGNPNGAMLLSIPDPVNLSNGFSNIVSSVEPAVVNISTTQIFEEPKDKRGAGAS
ncbi:MAG TPA: hypothetical protein VMV59_03840, partial [Candidatus Dormibacteraeota bacterium]|nr:hypothetical protein [Candidatus Dormibacteraeota bacterium]